MLEKASKSVWELILDNNGLGKEISETVERVFCRLSGQEPPLFPPNIETTSDKKKDKASEKGKGKVVENGNDNSESASKKRKLAEMNTEDRADEVVSGSSGPPHVPDDSSKLPQPNVKT